MPGEKGTVLWTPPPTATGIPYFVVTLDEDEPDAAGVLLAARNRAGRVIGPQSRPGGNA
jgi:hypothetical protein